MKVLLIEPDHILALAYKQAFENAGFKAKICTNAQSAITTIDKMKPDAIIVEILMSGHSGVEFLNEFRSYEDWSSIPVFINSSIPEYNFGSNPKTLASLDIAYYFYKPKTSLQKLVYTVKEIIENKNDT